MMKSKIIYIILVAMVMCSVATEGHAQRPQKRTYLPGLGSSWGGYGFDESEVHHPERIYIKLWDMRLDIVLPREEDRSGVSNIFFRDSASGEVRMLDSVVDNPQYGEEIVHLGRLRMDNHKYRRWANRFEPGKYDVIVLYNNGKYLVSEDVAFAEEMEMALDMTRERPRKADDNSREWLKMRKFTDIVGERMLAKGYGGITPHRIMGYMFFEDGDAQDGFRFVRIDEPWHRGMREAKVSYDGFFELDLESGSELYPIRVFEGSPTFTTLHAKANTWIFATEDPWGAE